MEAKGLAATSLGGVPCPQSGERGLLRGAWKSPGSRGWSPGRRSFSGSPGVQPPGSD